MIRLVYKILKAAAVAVEKDQRKTVAFFFIVEFYVLAYP